MTPQTSRHRGITSTNRPRITLVNFNRLFHAFALFAAVLCLGVFVPAAPAALQPDEILLITNKNEPQSQPLAELYCQLRGVPSTQIVALDLPDTEEMSFDTYETGVVAPVRQFLEDHQLRTKVKCLLTFYGVPFRIRAKVNTPAEESELAELQRMKAAMIEQTGQTAASLEAQAGQLDPAFIPGVGDSEQVLLARAQAAIAAIGPKIAAITDPTERTAQQTKLLNYMALTGGLSEIDSQIGPAQRDDPTKTDAQRQNLVTLHQNVLKARAQVRQLQAFRWDSHDRAELRNECRANFGLSGTMRVVDAQINYLTTTQTASATDNELPLLWEDYYPRQQWLTNPLNFAFKGTAPPTLMVMRLDGPDPATVQRMMRTSVEVEKTGLQGIIAIDARGISPIDDKGNPSAFGEFDQTLRDLAYLLRIKTNLKIKLDDQDLVFPAHSVKNVALYCGWYSVNQYIPGCDFSAGAVGYHIASFEMVTLHQPNSQWVRGLLNDGVVATLGAVAEPYLSAFPKPDEFFPLLLTGKLTMAEVYWKTTPITSWMISFIGDPLYCPYKVDPAMKLEDLPPRLRRAFAEAGSAAPSGISDSSRSDN
jgi:uncharacterized protein (TIGR03790 family)